MSTKSSIEWTDTTWNPVTGCTKVSPGCTHCYAETFAERWRGIKGHPFEQGFDLRLYPERLEQPLSWKKPRRVFVNSMSDLFHKDVPDSFIYATFHTMMLANQHIYQVLTKRPDRMRILLNHPPEQLAEIIEESTADHHPFGIVTRLPSDHMVLPAPNIWLGVSVEPQDYAWRVKMLRETPAAVRFLSVEPMIAPVDVSLEKIDWVICGGESGPGARPLDLEWARALRDQCARAGVAFFFKQVGSVLAHRGKGGNPEDIPRDLLIREFPAVG